MPLEKAPYNLTGPHRRPAGKYVLNPLDSRDGFKGRASYLAEALGGRWSHQAGGYVLSPAAAAKFELLHAAGYDARSRQITDSPRNVFGPHGGPYNLTAAQAMKQARAITLDTD